MPHIALLGDSIFDNAAYVAGGPDVVAQLRDRLPADWSATLCAIDGATTSDVRAQLMRIPHDASHLVLSVGGNDALGHSDILRRAARSAAEVLEALAVAAGAFEQRYRDVVSSLTSSALPLVLCTIYNGNFPDALTRRLTRTALTVFNDVIIRVAIESGVDVIDLRLVCADPADYANPIEPSVEGGAKIAEAIVRAISGPARQCTTIFGATA